MDDLHRPFRPRLARWVAWSVAGAVLVFMVALAVVLPDVSGVEAGLGDRLGVAGFGLLVAWFLSRQAMVRAVPDADGLTVRNLLVTRHVAWAEIISVRFGQGRAWAQLDLADGDTLAVMGIQASDGALGTVEAGRLATLVALHSITDQDS
jgi:hypothetical protein